MANRAIPIRDKVTEKIYPSEVAAGRELGPLLVPGAKQNNYVWFELHDAQPDRFQRMQDGEWVDYPPSKAALLRAKRDELLPRRLAGNGEASAALPIQKFSLTREVLNGSLIETEHFLIEASDREEAERVVAEEWPESENWLSGKKITLRWSSHTTAEWRIAWRHGRVKVLRPTKIPEDVQ